MTHAVRQGVRVKCARPFSSLPRRAASAAPTAGPARLDLRAIDAKWQKRWAAAPKHARGSASPKSYVLPMFAYPSGSLHMGHLRVYTISDVIARYRRMQGDDVLHPTGWDAFGLPAENAAIERGIDPAVWTERNIAKMKQQLKSMNTDFAWDAEISTCSPSFYKHTQALFLQLYRRGLAYQAEALVNYDPVDKTVLANEQVDHHGRSWRSGALVQQIRLRQWFFRITHFKETLLQDLDHLARDGRWPDRVLTQQRNWIGRSTGARVQFSLRHPSGETTPIYVFTTRPDTLFGVQFVVLSMTHPLVQRLAAQSPDLQRFLDKRASFAPDAKDGFELPLQAVHPLSHIYGSTDATMAPLKVFTAPYVLEEYGDGAVMGVPAHDARDLSFWRRHMPGSPIPVVVAPAGAPPAATDVDASSLEDAFTGRGVLTDRCHEFAGRPSGEAGRQIVDVLRSRGLAEPWETYRLRDWLVSRQRYWGTPIPIVHCAACGTVPVPEDQLPVTLPPLDASIRGQTGNALDRIDKWVHCSCPTCHGPAKRETDTMDTFVDSSWYFMRFPDPSNANEPFSRPSAAHMLPVDIYVGGVEHAILHLLYARFLYKFLCREGLVDSMGPAEPFQRLVAQGMVHGKTLSDPDSGRFLVPDELAQDGDAVVIKATGKTPNVTFEKMSKSKHNGVDPSAAIDQYGADALRAHILFAAPVSEVLQWDEEKIIGIQRWFGRVYRLVSDLADRTTDVDEDVTRTRLNHDTLTAADVAALLLVQTTCQRISHTFAHDIYSLNTAVSDLIKLTNGIHDVGTAKLSPHVARLTIGALLRMMAPITPAFAEECWEHLTQGRGGSIFDTPWSGAILSSQQEADLRSRQTAMTCAVQINGKVRFTAQIPVPRRGVDGPSDPAQREAEILESILSTEMGRLWLTEKNDWERRKKVIVVGAGRVLNVVF